MTPEEMKTRTRKFSLRVMRLVEALPRTRTGEIVGRQLLRCGTSVGANYRSACCARSKADFIARMGIVEEEADEAAYWMELLAEAELVAESRVANLMKECKEIVAIVVASINTARGQPRKRSE